MNTAVDNEARDIARFDEESMKQPAGVVLTSFSARKTSLIPVHRLPTEILTTIFILCARQVYYFGESPGSRSRSPPSWVNISYVCSRWRNAAINCPALWSYLFMVSRRWTEELLARSKQTPLKIVADLHPSGLPLRVFEPVADHVERIEELDLYLPGSRSSGSLFLSEFLSTPTPRLQNLSLSGLQKPWISFSFKGHTSALHTLKLTSCSVPWSSFPRSGLTTLVLHSVSGFEFRPFLMALGRMPCLAYLDIDDVISNSSSRAQATAHVTLLCLAYVTISASLPTIVVFLSCITIPLKAQLTLFENDDEAPTLEESARLFHLLSQRFSGPGDRAFAVPIIRSLMIDSHTTEVIFSVSEQISYNLKEQDSRYLLKATLTALNEDETILCFCRIIPATDLQRLLFTCPPFSPDIWRDILELFPSLRYIRLAEGPVPDDLAFLLASTSYADTQDEQVGQGPGRRLLPLLEELELFDIGFLEREEALECLTGLQDTFSTRTQPRCRFNMIQCHLDDNSVFDAAGWWEGDTFMVTSDLGDDDDSDDDESDDGDNDDDSDHDEEESEY